MWQVVKESMWISSLNLRTIFFDQYVRALNSTQSRCPCQCYASSSEAVENLTTMCLSTGCTSAWRVCEVHSLRRCLIAFLGRLVNLAIILPLPSINSVYLMLGQRGSRKQVVNCDVFIKLRSCHCIKGLCASMPCDTNKLTRQQLFWTLPW